MASSLIPPLDLHVSRYSNKAIADRLDLAPIRFTLGHPRWKLPYSIAGQIRVLAPTREEFALKDPAEFTAAYRGRLETLDPSAIAAEIAEIIVATPGAEGAVLLCFEDVRIGDLCHRSIFASWWEEKTGQAVPELEDPSAPKHKHPAPSPQPTLFD